MAAQFLRRTPNLVNFGLGDGMIRIVGAAVGPVDGASDDGGILTNEAKFRVHPEVGGGPYGRNKCSASLSGNPPAIEPLHERFAI
jgi:hypothetical protein